MTPTSLELLDEFYAEAMGCSTYDLNAGHLVVTANANLGTITWAKGRPLALFALGKGEATVISVHSKLKQAVEQAMLHTIARTLDDPLCDVLQEALTPLVSQPAWFRGLRLYCDSSTFVDRTTGVARDVAARDAHARELHAKWGGEVYGQIVDGQVVAWAAVKPHSDVAWDLSVETLPEHRRQGYAKSVASAAVKAILSAGKIAAWGSDRDNQASLSTARALGFQDYAFDFGCIGTPED